MRGRSSQGIHALLLACLLALACDKPEPLTTAKAQEVLNRVQFVAEPVYAEVPQRVWWNPKAPKDD
ncbi:MAG TPA: hypothetical protein VN605_06040, partial [Thermoanaerobaculia bacterium]|nr:hypothetical protein [Thermoanaerobaculia bacterium]